MLLAKHQHRAEAQRLVAAAGHRHAGVAHLDNHIVALLGAGTVDGAVRALATRQSNSIGQIDDSNLKNKRVKR